MFATLASIALEARIYDTQCGAKVFRRSASLTAALSTPFLSRWAFDVEFLGRLFIGTKTIAAISPSDVVEMALRTWHDVAGSKLSSAGWQARSKI